MSCPHSMKPNPGPCSLCFRAPAIRVATWQPLAENSPEALEAAGSDRVAREVKRLNDPRSWSAAPMRPARAAKPPLPPPPPPPAAKPARPARAPKAPRRAPAVVPDGYVAVSALAASLGIRRQSMSLHYDELRPLIEVGGRGLICCRQDVADAFAERFGRVSASAIARRAGVSAHTVLAAIKRGVLVAEFDEHRKSYRATEQVAAAWIASRAA